MLLVAGGESRFPFIKEASIIFGGVPVQPSDSGPSNEPEESDNETVLDEGFSNRYGVGAFAPLYEIHLTGSNFLVPFNTYH